VSGEANAEPEGVVSFECARNQRQILGDKGVAQEGQVQVVAPVKSLHAIQRFNPSLFLALKLALRYTLDFHTTCLHS
jgi:hypothetical protein